MLKTELNDPVQNNWLYKYAVIMTYHDEQKFDITWRKRFTFSESKYPLSHFWMENEHNIASNASEVIVK